MKNLILLIILQLIWLSGYAKSFVYVSLKSDNKVAVYEQDETSGELTLIERKPVSGGPASIAITSDKRRLYVAQRSSKEISCYLISKETGKLSLESTINAIDNPVYIALDKTGKYLLSVYFGASKMAIYSVDADGVLNETPIYQQNTPDNPHAIQVDAGNQFLYVTCMSGDRILQFNFDAETGKVEAMSEPEVVTNEGTGPRHIVFDPISDHLFVVNELASSVTNYQISKSGYLSLVESLSTLSTNFSGTNKCADIHITPNGKFLYATNRGAETIAAYSIGDSNRELSLVGFYNTEKTPREMAIDEAGKFLYSAGESSEKLQSYKINQITGVLEPLQNITVGKGPAWVEVVKVDVETSNTTKTTNEKITSISPNPFSQTTKIIVNEKSAALLGIYSINGKLLYQPENVSVEGEKRIYIWSGESYSGEVVYGQYLAVVKSKRGTETVKLLYQP